MLELSGCGETYETAQHENNPRTALFVDIGMVVYSLDLLGNFNRVYRIISKLF